MKFKATLIAAALLAANTASADLTVKITGATAFRASAVNAIKNTMTFPADAGGIDYGYAFNSTTLEASANAIFVGTMAAFPGQVVTVKCTWSGSVAGIRAISGNTNGTAVNVKFLALNPSTSANGTIYALSATGTAGVNADNLDDNSQADFAFADNTQSSTIYTNNTLDSRNVGVVPFTFVASRDMPAAVTNVTSQLFQSLYSTGRASAALFTNNPTDASDQVGGTMIYALGRDPFSGTRVVVMSETGLGTGSAVNQWTVAAGTGTSPNIEAGAVSPTSADTTTDSLNPVLAGNNGISGANMADWLRYKTTSINDTAALVSTKAAFIGYMSETDADRAVNGTASSVNGITNVGARYLSYNGVNAFGGKLYTSNNATTTIGSAVVSNIVTTGLVVGQFVRSTSGQLDTDNVIVSINANGTEVTLSKPALASATATANFQASNVLPASIWSGAYTLWGYELFLKRASLTTGDKFTFFNNLADRIHDVDFFYAGLSEASLRVSRSEDGGIVTSKYIFPEE